MNPLLIGPCDLSIVSALAGRDVVGKVDLIAQQQDPGSAFDIFQARIHPYRMYMRHVVLLGHATQKAFGFWNEPVRLLPELHWVEANGARWSVSPAPVPSETEAWTDPFTLRRSRVFWRDLVGYPA